MLYQNDQPVRRDGYLTDLITDEAVAFIDRAKAKPFFLYVPYTAPHSPFQGPNDRPAKPVSLKESSQGSRQAYRAMVERLDRGVGKVLHALDAAKLAGTTVVIFTSDNGGPQHARNDPFSGRKGSLFEGGIRVPCIVRWPGVLAEKKQTDHVGITMDLTASLVNIAGAKPPQEQPLDGMDLVQQIAQNRPVPDRTLYWRARRGERTWWAVREGSLKYLAQQDGTKKLEYLFDLGSDPGEQNSLLEQRGETVARLRRALAEWEKQVRPRR
jgi:N-acetylgalactosamine-6-sulfatase